LTFPVVLLGWAVFVVGGFAHAYMNLRTNRWWWGNSRDYRVYIRENGGPVWPIYVKLVCIPLGIAIAFGAILVSNRLH